MKRRNIAGCAMLVLLFCCGCAKRDPFDLPPLHQAVLDQDKTKIADLLARGEDPNGVAYDANTPLHRLRGDSAENLEIARILLEAGANVNARDRKGVTPLSWACALCSKDVARLLIDHGADVRAVSDTKRTALHIAVMWKDEMQVIDLLVAAGADVNAEDEDGCTPLHLACEKARTEAAAALVRNGADVSLKDKFGALAIHRAAAKDASGAIVKMLLSNGSPVDPKDNGGCTPLHCAVATENHNALRTLLKHGADATIQNAKGESPAAWAEELGFDDILGMLRGTNPGDPGSGE